MSYYLKLKWNYLTFKWKQKLYKLNLVQNVNRNYESDTKIKL